MLKLSKEKTELFNKLAQFIENLDDSEIITVLKVLERAWAFKQKEVYDKWQRSLPLADYIVDRWTKARVLGFGEGSSIYDSSLVIGEVNVGCNTWIGPFTLLDGSGGLEIGDNCSISAGVQIYTHDTVDWAISGGLEKAKNAPVKIGNNCYIGPNCIIQKGIKIGDGCVIGAQSLVNINIPRMTRAWGSPVQITGKV